MQGNYVKLAHLLASDLRKRAIRGLISGSLTPEHHIDFHTMSGVLVIPAGQRARCPGRGPRRVRPGGRQPRQPGPRCPGPEMWTDWPRGPGPPWLPRAAPRRWRTDQAAATAPDGHQLDRGLNAKNTPLCVLAGCLFPGEGYDAVLRIALGMPGLDLKPGTEGAHWPGAVQGQGAVRRAGARRAFELDAARSDVDLGIGSAWHGTETTSLTARPRRYSTGDELADAFGVPAGGTNPRSASSRTSAPGPAAGSGWRRRRLPRRGVHPGR